MELLTEEERRFQRREWGVQKVGTVVLVAVLLAALTGLLGAGPLAWTTRSSAGGLVSVEFDRVTRFKTDDTLTVTFAPEAVENGQVTLDLTGPWISGVDVRGISPEPVHQRALSDGIAMTFLADPSGQTAVTFSFRAGEHFALEGRAAAGGEFVTFTQFVLP